MKLKFYTQRMQFN